MAKRFLIPGKPFFAPARMNERYSAREFNRLTGTVSRRETLSTETPDLFLPVRHAITVEDAEENYPEFGDYPNLYPVQWILIDYPRTPGGVDDDVTYLDGGELTPGSPEPDNMVLNVYQWGNDSALYTPYIPKGSIIQCYFANGQWFTHTNVMTTRFRGQLDGAITGASETATVDNLLPLNGRLMGFDDLTAKNIHEWDGDNNADCRVEWNAYEKQWELMQLTCPA
jgi:hypothetical protein